MRVRVRACAWLCVAVRREVRVRAGCVSALDPAKSTDIDKQEFNLVPLDLKTFIDFYVFLLGIRFCTDFTLLRQP